MTPAEKYTIFLIEQYRFKSKLPGREVYNLFKKHGILEYIKECFEALHTMDTDFVVSEIEEMVKKNCKDT